MRTHKILGAVQFIDDEGRVVGQVVGSAQRHAYAMVAAQEMVEALEAAETLHNHVSTCEECGYGEPCLFGAELQEKVTAMRHAALAKARGESQ